MMEKRIFFRLVITALVVFVFLFPLIWTLLNSFKTTAEVTAYPATIFPKQLYIGAWINTLNSSITYSCMSNSLLYSLIIALLCIGIAFPATYVISRYKFRTRMLISSIMYIIMLTPSTILIFPVFLIATLMKFVDTVWGYILVMVAILCPFAFFLLKPYIDAIPIEVEEAAIVDGASFLQLFIKVLVPVAANGLVTTFFLVFVAAFNDFGIAFGMLTSDSIKTYPLLLLARLRFLQWQGSWSDILSMSLLALIPALFIFLLFSKRLQEAILKGGLKA